MSELLRPLELPRASRTKFVRNTIKQAFCELRFPTLPDLDKEPPKQFVMAIRRLFPHYERGVGLTIGVTDRGVEQVPEASHQFLSQNRLWTAWLRNSSLGVETRGYADFHSFSGRVEQVLNAAKPCLDTDFFTRVGLRYVNVLPAARGDIRGWVNDALLGPLGLDMFQGSIRHLSETRGRTSEGDYSFRFGLVQVEGELEPKYVLDADFSAEAVEWGKTLALIERLNRLNFDMYAWAIGDRTREFLGPPLDETK